MMVSDPLVHAVPAYFSIKLCCGMATVSKIGVDSATSFITSVVSTSTEMISFLEDLFSSWRELQANTKTISGATKTYFLIFSSYD